MFGFFSKDCFHIFSWCAREVENGVRHIENKHLLQSAESSLGHERRRYINLALFAAVLQLSQAKLYKTKFQLQTQKTSSRHPRNKIPWRSVNTTREPRLQDQHEPSVVHGREFQGAGIFTHVLTLSLCKGGVGFMVGKPR